MQCPDCHRRVRRNKNGTIPVHYIEEFPLIGWEQKRCPAAGGTGSGSWANRRADSSRMFCPCCRTTVGKKKDGRMRVHNDAHGRECKASVANR